MKSFPGIFHRFFLVSSMDFWRNVYWKQGILSEISFRIFPDICLGNISGILPWKSFVDFPGSLPSYSSRNLPTILSEDFLGIVPMMSLGIFRKIPPGIFPRIPSGIFPWINTRSKDSFSYSFRTFSKIFLAEFFIFFRSELSQGLFRNLPRY